METLETRITNIVSHKVSPYSSAGRKFLIGKTEAGLTVMGEAENPLTFALYRFYGTRQAGTGRFTEEQFKFVSYEPILESTTEGYIKYISENFPGLGKAYAGRLVDRFGNEVLSKLRDEPEETLNACKINAKNYIEQIKTFFEDNDFASAQTYAKLYELFAGHRFPKRVVASLADDLKADAIEIIKNNPYILMDYPGVGWKTVDPFAVNTLKYDRFGNFRHQAAVLEALSQLSDQGHTCATQAEIERIVVPLIGCHPLPSLWGTMLDCRKLVADTTESGTLVYALPKLNDAERNIAQRLVAIQRGAIRLDVDYDREGLEPEQDAAITMKSENGVMIITGPPGTGKSYVTARIIKSIFESGIESIHVVAPTGKAAKRASELIEEILPESGISCSTIHRALGVDIATTGIGIPQADARVNRGRKRFGFAHNKENQFCISMCIMDETSMCDVELMSDYLDAVPDTANLLIVGDHNQLPSVGPGSVLRDVMRADLPCTVLDTVRRSSGKIVEACHAIKDGRVTRPSQPFNLATKENWSHIEAVKPEEIVEIIKELYVNGQRQKATQPDHPFWQDHDPFWDMQVVSPQYAKIVGCDNINRILSNLLNPPQDHENLFNEELDENIPKFRVGDKVIRTKNGACGQLFTEPEYYDYLESVAQEMGEEYADAIREDTQIDILEGSEYYLCKTCYIVNGDIGKVLDIDRRRGFLWVYVQFRSPDRLCRLPFGESHLRQAYAITAHKSQGSGIPYVIIPVWKGYYYDINTEQGLWNRPWIYTAMSRAETILRTVGQFDAIKQAASRKTIHGRRTLLTKYIKEEMARVATSPENCYEIGDPQESNPESMSGDE